MNFEAVAKPAFISAVRYSMFDIRNFKCFCLGLATVCILLLQGCARRDPPAKKAGEGSVPVTVAKVVAKNVPVELQAVGNVEAFSTITVKAQVGGELTRVSFHEGDFVKKGDLLFTIDTRQLEAQLNQAQANLARDEAQRGQVEANLARDLAQERYSKAESARYASLLTHGLISKEQEEQVRTSAEASTAAVLADEANLRSANAAVGASKAAVENLRVQLSYAAIRSPIDGRTGNLNVKQGNIVTPNVTELMTINQVEPIYVTFSVPEARRAEIKKAQAVMASPTEDFSSPDEGELAFIDNAVDSTTGTIRLKGTFTNKGHRLWPGEFVRIKLRLTTIPDALVVPNQAVQSGQDGSYVFVVREDRSVESRPVVTGARVDQDLVIDKGLRAGETVVTEGQLRLAPNMRVQLAGAPGDAAKRKPRASEVGP